MRTSANANTIRWRLGTCRRKVRHDSRPLAFLKWIEIASCGDEQAAWGILRVYHCDVCDGWHLGHQFKKKRAQRHYSLNQARKHFAKLMRRAEAA